MSGLLVLQWQNVWSVKPTRFPVRGMDIPWSWRFAISG